MLNLFHKLNFKNIRRQNSFNFSKIILVFLISLSFLIVTGNAFGEVILDKQLIRPDDILKEKVEVTPCIPTYSLPLRVEAVSYTHLRAHETRHDLVCRLLLEKKKKTTT